jgi:hypothetical protein
VEPSPVELTELQALLRLLTRRRNNAVQRAQESIAQANRDYDELAWDLHRRIEILRAKEESRKPQLSRVTIKHITHDPEWAEQDIDHFYELLKREN